MRQKRGDISRQSILDAGLALARSNGIGAVTARGVALALDRSHTGVRYHFDAPDKLRHAVILYALECKDATVIARLILDDHPGIAKLSATDRRRYMHAAFD